MSLQNLSRGDIGDADSPRFPLIVGVSGLVLFFALFLGWASTMSVSGAAIATGQIAVEGNRKAIQHRDGGPIAAILVREGERVKRNQPLIELDLTETRAEVAVLSSAKALAEIRLARLRAESEGAPSVSWPIALPIEDEKIQANLAQEQRLFEARRAAYLGNVQLQNQQIKAHQAQIEGLRARMAATESQQATVRAEIESIQPLIASGLVLKPRVLALDRSAAAFQGELEALRNSVTAEQAGIYQAQGKIEQLEKDRGENIAKEISETEAKLADTTPRLNSAKDRLARAVLYAPEDGYVYNLAVFSRGAVLVPGQTVLEIVPLDEPLVLRAEINPTDIDRVRPGQDVTVHLAPFTQRWQSVIHGKLTKISADRFDDQQSKKAFYRGVVELDQEELKKAGIELSPGMPGDAVIQTEARTILAYFLDPVLQVYDFALREK